MRAMERNPLPSKQTLEVVAAGVCFACFVFLAAVVINPPGVARWLIWCLTW